jgi:hypothetical protein
VDVTHSDREPARTWPDRVIDLSGSAYGTILASSLLAALSYKERGDAWVMIGALLATELVFALAHVLSTLLGGGRVRGRLPGLADVRRALRFEWPVLQAAWPAIILLLGAGVGLFGIDTAVTIALVVNAAILFVWGVAVAGVHGATPALMLAVGALSCGLGAALVLLKLALH